MTGRADSSDDVSSEKPICFAKGIGSMERELGDGDTVGADVGWGNSIRWDDH
jgi:hypothetical protein